jgi:serine/threonine-protein kinase
VPIPIASAIAVGVLEGLHAAHEATSDLGEPLGIVHRDVSPQNILVGTDGVARVVDFGVAKAAGRVQTTRDGQLKGKLGYMAPEQIRGIATRATDVHAVSVVLWEMLTARRLYHAETDVQTFSNILAGTGIIAASKLAPLVSPALDRVILRGLQANPDERFPTAREMARALTNASPPASPSDVGDWVASMAAKSLSSRALKIAAIESSGALPSPGSSPDPLDVSPFSHPPVSVDRLRSLRPPRAAMVLVPVALATVGLGAAIGLFVHAPSPKAAAASVERPRPAVASAPPEKAAPPSPRPSAVPEVTPSPASTIPTVAVSALAPPDTRHVAHSTVVARPVTVQTAAPPQTPTAKPPAQGANDFAHVMDSRK